MRISDWSSDVCSSDLPRVRLQRAAADPNAVMHHSLGIGQPSRRSFGTEVEQFYLALRLRIRHPSKLPYNGIRGWHPNVEYLYVGSIAPSTASCNGGRNSRRLGQG